jgi:hypothetical protein
MPVDDPLDVRLRQLKEDAAFETDRDFGDAAISAILDVFPIGGAAIGSLIKGRANRNVRRRIIQLFEEMRKRLDEIQALVPDEEFFGSEEFQTLLALAIQTLQTTRDENKRRMLANALANSGSAAFSGDADKEQYIRTLRDLSPIDIGRLKLLRERATRRNLRGDILSSFSRLISLGLVTESLVGKPRPPVPGGREAAARAFVEMATQLPDRRYEISDYGRRLLEFLSCNVSS